VHETGIGMIADYMLQDGKRLGTRRVTSLDTAFVDSLFAKLLYKDLNGEKVERRTTCNHAFKTARNALNTISRANPGVFPLKNPFEKMGLIAGDTRETPHATFEQLMTFRVKAIAMGYPTGGLMVRRDGTGRSWVGKDEQLTQVERKCREIIDAADLPPIIDTDGES
jgi:hypothetical protein